MKHALLLALVACGGSHETVKNVPPAAGGEPRATIALVGPDATIGEACHKAQACEEVAPEFDPPETTGPGCSAVDDPAQLPGTAIGGVEVKLAPVACNVAKGYRMEGARYHLYVHDKDGWYMSPSLFAVDYNEHYCDATVTAKWETRGDKVVATMTLGQGCSACNKQGRESAEYDFVVVIDPKKRVVYDPIPVALRTSQEPDDQLKPSEADCPKKSSSFALHHEWTPDGHLAIAGAEPWTPPTRTADGWRPEPDQRGPSPARTYSFP